MKVSANGIDIHFEVAGEGPWVTLAHSLSGDLSIWRDQVGDLTDRFSVLCYDIRGHGKTAATEPPYSLELLADDLLALWDKLRIRESHFIGISMGGMIGQVLALKAPERVKSLVLADTTSRYPAETLPTWEERIRAVREHGLEALVRPTLERWFTAPFRLAHPEVVDRIGHIIRHTPEQGYIGCAHAISRIDVTERLHTLGCPTLVIVGADDQGTPPAMAREIAEAIPGARLVVLPDTAHLSNVEQAIDFNQLLLEFLPA